MIANGVFVRPLRRAMFWEQSAALVVGERIWTNFRHRGGRVGMMFWQQSLGEDVDVLLSPAPASGACISTSRCSSSDSGNWNRRDRC